MLKFFRFGRRDAKAPPKASEPTSAELNASAPSPLPLLSLDLPSPLLHANDAASGKAVTHSGSEQSLWVDVTEDSLNSLGEVPPTQTEHYGQQHARLTPAEALLLLRPCVDEIKTRGLDTLGLFRPYRTLENPRRINKIITLFLKSFQTELAASPALTNKPLANDLFDLDTQDPTQGYLEELSKSAGVHDVAFVLRWAIRHLYPSLEPINKQTAWYTHLQGLDTSVPLPDQFFSTQILALLSKDSQELLLLVLDLIAAVATYSEFNGMSSTHLCKVLGFWLLSQERNQGTPYETTGYNGIAQDWHDCAVVLETIFVAYLSEQKDLPKRLRQIKRQKREVEATDPNALQVTLQTKDWKPLATGSDSRGREVKRRRTIGDLYDYTLRSATSDTIIKDDASWQAWKEFSDRATQANSTKPPFKTVLSDESTRLISLLSPPEPSVPASPDSPNRRRSFSVDSPNSPSAAAPQGLDGKLAALSEDPERSSLARSLSSAIGNFPNKSFSNLQVMPRSQSAYATSSGPAPSWSDFISKGFDSEANPDKAALKLDAAFAASPVPAEKAHAKLVKRTPSQIRRRRELQASTNSVISQQSEITIEPALAPSHSIVLLKLTHVDETWADVWVDAMGDPAVRAKWPTFAVAQVANNKGSIAKWMVVEEVYTNTEAPVPEPASPTRSVVSESPRQKEKRAFLTFAKRTTKRMTILPSSASQTDLPRTLQEPVEPSPPPRLPPIAQSPASEKTLPKADTAGAQPNAGPLARSSSHHGSTPSSRRSSYSIPRVKPPSVHDVLGSPAVGAAAERPKSSDAEVLLDDPVQKDSSATGTVLGALAGAGVAAVAIPAAIEAAYHPSEDGEPTTGDVPRDNRLSVGSKFKEELNTPPSSEPQSSFDATPEATPTAAAQAVEAQVVAPAELAEGHMPVLVSTQDIPLAVAPAQEEPEHIEEPVLAKKVDQPEEAELPEPVPLPKPVLVTEEAALLSEPAMLPEEGVNQVQDTSAQLATSLDDEITDVSSKAQEEISAEEEPQPEADLPEPPSPQAIPQLAATESVSVAPAVDTLAPEQAEPLSRPPSYAATADAVRPRAASTHSANTVTAAPVQATDLPQVPRTTGKPFEDLQVEELSLESPLEVVLVPRLASYPSTSALSTTGSVASTVQSFEASSVVSADEAKTPKRRKLSLPIVKKVITTPFRRKKSSSNTSAAEEPPTPIEPVSPAESVPPISPALESFTGPHIQTPAIETSSFQEEAVAVPTVPESRSMAASEEEEEPPVVESSHGVPLGVTADEQSASDVDLAQHESRSSEDSSFARVEALEAVPEVDEEPTQLFRQGTVLVADQTPLTQEGHREEHLPEPVVAYQLPDNVEALATPATEEPALTKADVPEIALAEPEPPSIVEIPSENATHYAEAEAEPAHLAEAGAAPLEEEPTPAPLDHALPSPTEDVTDQTVPTHTSEVVPAETAGEEDDIKETPAEDAIIKETPREEAVIEDESAEEPASVEASAQEPSPKGVTAAVSLASAAPEEIVPEPLSEETPTVTTHHIDNLVERPEEQKLAALQQEALPKAEPVIGQPAPLVPSLADDVLPSTVTPTVSGIPQEEAAPEAAPAIHETLPAVAEEASVAPEEVTIAAEVAPVETSAQEVAPEADVFPRSEEAPAAVEDVPTAAKEAPTGVEETPTGVEETPTAVEEEAAPEEATNSPEDALVEGGKAPEDAPVEGKAPEDAPVAAGEEAAPEVSTKAPEDSSAQDSAPEARTAGKPLEEVPAPDLPAAEPIVTPTAAGSTAEEVKDASPSPADHRSEELAAEPAASEELPVPEKDLPTEHLSATAVEPEEAEASQVLEVPVTQAEDEEKTPGPTTETFGADTLLPSEEPSPATLPAESGHAPATEAVESAPADAPNKDAENEYDTESNASYDTPHDTPARSSFESAVTS